MKAKEVIKKVLRNHLPNIPVLRHAMNAAKLREINRYIMDPADVKAGESTLTEQIRLVGKYSELWPAQAKKMNDLLEDYIPRCDAVRDRDDLDELRCKVLFACYAYGFRPDEYFAFNLEKRTFDDWRAFISDRETLNVVYRMNDIIDVGVFFDKNKTYETFKPYYKREAISVTKASDRASFENFAVRHPLFVIKNVKLSKGDSVKLIDSSEIDLSKLFDEMLSSGEFIVEECVKQSDYMSQLSLKSVNTIRVMTFSGTDGVKVGPCFLKIARGDSFVDNAGAGGVAAGIDPETGIVGTVARDEFCNSYEIHPDTGITIKGFQLPDWQDMRDMVKEMALITPGVRYIGWDLAHTDEGWVVIEGNGSGQFIMPQITWQRGFRDDIEALIGEKI